MFLSLGVTDMETERLQLDLLTKFLIAIVRRMSDKSKYHSCTYLKWAKSTES
jgi:hypothetical protein